MDPKEKLESKEKLKLKLKKKKEQRSAHGDGGRSEPINPFDGQTDILQMMENVNKILKTNPQMVQQISKCVSNVMNNQELMSSLAGQLEKELEPGTSSSSQE